MATPSCGHRFPWELHAGISSQGRVRSVVKMGGVVKHYGVVIHYPVVFLVRSQNGIFQRPVPSRRRLPCLDGALPV